jgi:hypothetical protein
MPAQVAECLAQRRLRKRHHFQPPALLVDLPKDRRGAGQTLAVADLRLTATKVFFDGVHLADERHDPCRLGSGLDRIDEAPARMRPATHLDDAPARVQRVVAAVSIRLQVAAEPVEELLGPVPVVRG